MLPKSQEGLGANPAGAAAMIWGARVGWECRPGTAEGPRPQGEVEEKGLAGHKGEMREGRSKAE